MYWSGKPRLLDLHDHLPSQLQLGAVLLRSAVLFRMPEAKGNREALASAAPQQNDHVKAAHLAFLARGASAAHLPAPSAERLAHHHVVYD